ncbi:MAG: ArnT family glycosyltransferase, partial [Endomicrobiia bacterium]
FYVLIAPPRPLNWDDTLSWDAVGWNLAQGKGFKEIDGSPTHVRPPLYPIFLAGIYTLFGHDFLFVQIFQALFGAFTVLIIFFLCNEIFEEKKIANISGFLLCLYPPLIVYTQIIGSEVFYTFLLALTIYLFVKRNILLGSLFLGLTNICRSTTIFYIFFLIFGLIIFIPEMRNFKWIKIFILSIIISFLPVIPWTVRNYLTFNRFLLVNTSAGELFWSGTYLPWNGICKTGRDQNFFEKFNLPNPIDNERKMFKEGIKNIIGNPGGFIKLTIKKFFRFWFQPVGAILVSKKSAILSYTIYLLHFLWIILAVYGFIKAPNKILYLPLTVLLIYFGIMHNLIAPIARYRLPIEPYIMVFAVYGFYQLILKKKGLNQNG